MQCVIRDGAAGKAYKKVFPSSLTFDPPGEQLAYVAQVGEGRFLVVVDGVEKPPHENIGLHLKFSPDGRSLAYAAKDGGQWRVLLDEEPGPPHDDVYVKMIRYSGDGSRIAYPAQDSVGFYMIIQDRGHPEGTQEYGPYEDVTVASLSNDGTRIAYAIRRGDLWSMTVDGIEEMLATAYGKGTPLFGTDGYSAGYTALVEGHWLLVINGEIINVISGEISERAFVATIEETFWNQTLHHMAPGSALLLADPYTTFSDIDGRAADPAVLRLAPGPHNITVDLKELRGGAQGVDVRVEIPAPGIYMLAFEYEQHSRGEQLVENLIPSLGGWRVGQFNIEGLRDLGHIPQRWMTFLLEEEKREQQVIGILKQRWRPLEIRQVAAKTAVDMLYGDQIGQDRIIALLSEIVVDESEDREIRRTIWEGLVESGLDDAVPEKPAGL